MRNLSGLVILSLTFSLQPAEGMPSPSAAGTEPIRHPALFLVGDSIMKTGTGNGETGPWGWGSEIGAMFDPAKIHVYNMRPGDNQLRRR